MQVEKRTYKISSLAELLSPLVPANTGNYELTDEEKEAALREAQQKKEAAMRYDEEMERRRIWEREFRRPWSAQEMQAYIEWKAAQKGIPFRIDGDNHAVIKALCQYFTGDPSFEKTDDGYSLKKGIMLCGPVGTGKTTIMKLFRANQRRSFQWITCRELADRFKKDGEELLHVWSNPINVPAHIDTFWQNQLGACFDDLGTEGTKKHYGDAVNVMADILLNRYDQAVIPFHYTHITTNLTSDEIEQYYGSRVRSRMREMFNMLVLGGEDRRK
jgi:DNA replication protein DnaC